MAAQLRVAVWLGGSVTLAGLIAPQVNPAGDEADTDRATVPEKVPTGATVTVLGHEAPAKHGTGLGLAVRVKVFPRLNTTLTLCVSEPLVPVTGTVKLPGDAAVQARDAVADPPLGTLTLAGSVQVIPAGSTWDRVSVPENVFKLAAVIVELPESVAELTGLGDAVRLKSTTWKRIDAVVWDNVPSVPVTVTV